MPVLLWLLALGGAGYYFVVKPDVVLVECRDRARAVRVEFELASFVMARITGHHGTVTMSDDFLVRSYRAVDEGVFIRFLRNGEGDEPSGSFRRFDAVLYLPESGGRPAFAAYCLEIARPL